MSAQTIDHVAILPGYLAAATAVLVLLTDLVLHRRAAVVCVAALGFLATGITAGLIGTLPARQTFCTADGCSYVTGPATGLIGAVLAGCALATLALAQHRLRAVPRPLTDDDTGDTAPAGEFGFLLAASLTGGVVLAGARDLITIVIALETLTLPLYVLVALRFRPTGGADPRSADAAVGFLLMSVVAGAVTLMGAALLYVATGQVQLAGVAAVLDQDGAGPLVLAAMTMLLGGIGFKLAAVPLHGWAPGTYDAAPPPIAGYLSTASKLGGVAALLWIVTVALRPVAESAGPVLAVLAVASMTTGNLVALRQTRTVRLLAWSSVAQGGYLLVPLAGLAATGTGIDAATATVLAFAVFYVLLETAAFAAVVALRGRRIDGGALADVAGAGRRHPASTAVLVLALLGLAGLPPGFAGLFAKVTVVSAVASPAPWLAVVVVVNAVVGLVYYLRFAVLLVRPVGGETAEAPRWPVTVVLVVTTMALVVTGFAPQLVLRLAQ